MPAAAPGKLGNWRRSSANGAARLMRLKLGGLLLACTELQKGSGLLLPSSLSW